MTNKQKQEVLELVATGEVIPERLGLDPVEGEQVELLIAMSQTPEQKRALVTRYIQQQVCDL